MHKCILARTQEPDNLMSPAQKHWKVNDLGRQLQRRGTSADLQQKQGGPPKGEVLLPSMGGSLVWGGETRWKRYARKNSGCFYLTRTMWWATAWQLSGQALHMEAFICATDTVLSCWSTQPAWWANCSIKHRGLLHPFSSQIQLNAFYYRHLKLFTIMLSEMV